MPTTIATNKQEQSHKKTATDTFFFFMTTDTKALLRAHTNCQDAIQRTLASGKPLVVIITGSPSSNDDDSNLDSVYNRLTRSDVADSQDKDISLVSLLASQTVVLHMTLGSDQYRLFRAIYSSHCAKPSINIVSQGQLISQLEINNELRTCLRFQLAQLTQPPDSTSLGPNGSATTTSNEHPAQQQQQQQTENHRRSRSESHGVSPPSFTPGPSSQRRHSEALHSHPPRNQYARLRLAQSQERQRVLDLLEKDRAEQRSRRKEELQHSGGAPAASDTSTKSATTATPPSRRFTTIIVRQLDGEPLKHQFSPNSTLDDVRTWIDSMSTNTSTASSPYIFLQTVPRKKFDPAVDEYKTLRELGLSPSATLILRIPPGASSTAYPTQTPAYSFVTSLLTGWSPIPILSRGARTLSHSFNSLISGSFLAIPEESSAPCPSIPSHKSTPRSSHHVETSSSDTSDRSI